MKGMLALEFLENSERTLRSLSLDVEGLSPVGLVLGQGSQGLEVAILSSPSKPVTSALQKAFKDRKG